MCDGRGKLPCGRCGGTGLVLTGDGRPVRCSACAKGKAGACPGCEACKAAKDAAAAKGSGQLRLFE